MIVTADTRTRRERAAEALARAQRRLAEEERRDRLVDGALKVVACLLVFAAAALFMGAF